MVTFGLPKVTSLLKEFISKYNVLVDNNRFFKIYFTLLNKLFYTADNKKNYIVI